MAASLPTLDEIRAAVRALATKWRAAAKADAGDYYGDQFERRDECADELEALLPGGDDHRPDGAAERAVEELRARRGK